jgi:hypothetical protein
MTKSPVSPPEPEPVAETFEKELEDMKEKEREMKGEQRKFFSSIVERVRNNVEVLRSLREEHLALRTRLSALEGEKAKKSAKSEKISEPNLQAAIKHRTHEVLLLKKQIDTLYNKKEEAIHRQSELEVVLANFQTAANYEHPEAEQIKTLKNKLDKANIKNSETKHLMKIYTSIITHFGRQQMLWNPLVQKQQREIERKHRDISELTLIARDSKFSKATAKSEFVRTERECSEQQKKRETLLSTKRKQLMDIGNMQMAETDSAIRPSRMGVQLSGRQSQLRGRQNKMAREKREERYRQAMVQYDRVRDEFGTTDAKEIEKVFIDRRGTSACLQQQIDDLRRNREELNAQVEKVRLAIEEQEFTTAKGVGVRRMTSEGSQILNNTRRQLRASERELEAFHTHQKAVLSGIAHLLDIVSLVTTDEDTIPSTFPGVMEWVNRKVSICQSTIDEEDATFIPLVNQQVYATYKSRMAPGEEEIKRPAKATDGFKRRAKDQKGDVQTRVLDRGAVKAAAVRAVQLVHQQKRGGGSGRK